MEGQGCIWSEKAPPWTGVVPVVARSCLCLKKLVRVLTQKEVCTFFFCQWYTFCGHVIYFVSGVWCAVDGCMQSGVVLWQAQTCVYKSLLLMWDHKGGWCESIKAIDTWSMPIGYQREWNLEHALWKLCGYEQTLCSALYQLFLLQCC